MNKIFGIAAISILATALVATAVGASTGPVGVVSLIEISPKDKAQNEKNGDGRAPVLLATHSFVEITQVERLRAFQACQKAGKTDCNTDKYRHEWSVPFITVENANKLEKALSLAWNRFDARVNWRLNTVINNFGVLPFPHRDYLLPTFSFSGNCLLGGMTGFNIDTKLGAWDGSVLASMKASDFCDDLTLDKAVSLASTHLPYPAPCGLGGGTVYWNEVARRYAEAMKHALTKYYPDYWIDVAKAFAMYMPQALDWGGFGPTSSLVPGTEGGSLIAPVYASIPNPVQYVNLATKAAALDPLVGYSYIMQKYPYMLNPIGNAVLQNKGVLSLANITNETTTGIAQLEQLKYKLSTREDIFNRTYQWSLTGAAKPTGNTGAGTLREVEAIGYAPFLRVYSKVDKEISPRPVMLMVSCGQLVFTPFPNLVERIYPVPVSPAPLPVAYIVPRVHTEWMSVPEGYEIPKVKGVPSFKSLVGIGFSIPSLPTMPSLPTFETPTLPTTTVISETLKKPVNLPAGFVVPVGNSITLPGGQVLKPGDTLKEAFTLPVGTAWAIDTAKKTATTAVTNAVTGGSSGTTPTSVVIPVPAPNTTTIPGTKPANPGGSVPANTSTTETLTKPVALPAGYTVPAGNKITLPTGQVLKPGDTLKEPYTLPVGTKWSIDPTKPTTPGTVKPTTPGTSGSGSSNPGTGNTTSVEESSNQPPAPEPTTPQTTVTTSAFPVLSWGDANHCVQMLHGLLYGQNRFQATDIDDLLSRGSAYMLDAIEMIEAYRKEFGINDGDPKTVTASVWLHLLNRKASSNVGVSLAFQIGLVNQGYDIKINGKWDQAGIDALTQFAKKHGHPATFNSKLFGLLLKPCGYTIVRDGNSFVPKSPFDNSNTTPVDPSPSTPEPDNTPPPPPAPNEGDVTINSSVYYPGCQTADTSILSGCDIKMEGEAVDAVNDKRPFPGNTYAVAIPGIKVYKGSCGIPYGSIILITNPKNNKAVKAEVRDAGPFVPDRNMDMTDIVQRDLGFGRKVGPVSVRLISLPAGAPNRASYCFGNAKTYRPSVINANTIAPGPTLPNPFYKP